MDFKMKRTSEFGKMCSAEGESESGVRLKVKQKQELPSGNFVKYYSVNFKFVFHLICVLFIYSNLLTLVTGTVNPLDRPCIPRDFGRGSVVCVCNATYCDSLRFEGRRASGTGSGNGNGNGNGASQEIPSPPSTRTRTTTTTTDEQDGGDVIQIYTSTKSGQRLHKSTTRFSSLSSQFQQRGKSKRSLKDEKRTKRTRRSTHHNHAHTSSFNNVTTNHSRKTRTIADTFRVFSSFPRPDRISKFQLRRSKVYQTILGLGGSFTDAAGLNIASLSQATQENLMKSYFGQDGNDYSMGRVPMGGTDFSTRPYTYDDRGDSPDANLTHFSLQPEDFDLKLPYIKWADSLRGGDLKLIASPWSAPSFMTTRRNNKLNGAGVLRKEYYQTWADYFVRFLDEYKKEGVSVWGVTTGNEPFNGFVTGFPFNCMGWKAADARDWIINNLGPTLKSKRSDLNVRIVIFDDNKGGLPTWTKEILENNRSAQYVDGIGTHWYFDFLTGNEVLTRVHNKHPDQFIIQTEACLGFTPWERYKVIPGSWERGEKYLEAIISDMNNWVSGWIDWNLAVDLAGGPNWAKLAADAAILVDAKKDEFFKQPIYYAIGHVSKFVPPDSKRIGLSGTHVPSNLQSVAFLRPDNGTVVVFLNRLSYDAKVSLFDEEKGSVFLLIPARSMQTIVYY